MYIFLFIFVLDKKPPKEWPQKGQIMFKNFSLRYSPDTPHVLKDLNIEIEPMEKVIFGTYLCFKIVMIMLHLGRNCW